MKNQIMSLKYSDKYYGGTCITLIEVDFGLGEEGNKAVDKKKLYDQTGDIYYRGRGAEGNPIPIPITELANKNPLLDF